MNSKKSDARRVVAYAGYRGDGRVIVVRLHADGSASALPPRFDLRKHSPDGFEWGYSGSGPAQLALAILADRFPADTARDFYQDFKFAVVASWSSDTWAIPAAIVEEWLNGWRSYQVADAADSESDTVEFAEGGAA